MNARIQPLVPSTALTNPKLDATALRRSALNVVGIEARAIEVLESRIDDSFLRACQMMYECTGRVVVSGMGKSGHIARKIAATLASTGTPAFFVHPGEASHGDLGMITNKDVVLALSNSGETDELLTILPAIKRQGNPLIVMTGNPGSSRSTMGDVLDVSIPEEACPLSLRGPRARPRRWSWACAGHRAARARGSPRRLRSRIRPAPRRRLLLHIAPSCTPATRSSIRADASLSDAWSK
jgi:arabinose-5-phosphate isomerase